MCCETKRKIADCVKNLARYKAIRKITIQNIMQATQMSRQSFYYHFKDIYDVLEWIGIHDFVDSSGCRECETVESWMLQLVAAIRADRVFYERMVLEIDWPKLLSYLYKPMEKKIVQLFGKSDQGYLVCQTKDSQLNIRIFMQSFCYYLMDYIYNRRNVSDEQILRELKFLVSILEGPPLTCHKDMAQKTMIAV